MNDVSEEGSILRKIIMIGMMFVLIGIGSACKQAENDNADLANDEASEGVSVLTGDKPPKLSVEVDGTKYATELGTYCWELESENTAECVDAIVLEEDIDPVKVAAGEEVTLTMEYTPTPNQTHLSIENTEIAVINNQFSAPEETGTYFYNYSVWWLDEKDRDVSNGSADYGFVLEVD